MADYQIWLTNPLGRRITSMDEFAYISYTKTTKGLGTILIGFPFDYVKSKLGKTYFSLDNRIDVWRRPLKGMEFSRDAMFFLRKFRVYQRAEDNMLMIEYFGRSPLDLLNRGYTNPAAVYPFTATIDQYMGYIIAGSSFYNLTLTIGLWTASNFPAPGDGPTLTFGFKDYRFANVLDALTDLKNISETMNSLDPAQKKCSFDVVPVDTDKTTPLDIRIFTGNVGRDRTSGTIFSIESGNLIKPVFSEDYLDEITIAQMGSTFVYSVDALLSPLNSIIKYREPSTSDPTSEGNKILAENAFKRTFSGVFVDSPGGASQPRSLYGLDWDLGDLLPVKFANRVLTAEVIIVYVNIDDKGKEEVTGRTEVGE